MQKRQEMYDKLVEEVDDSIQSIRNRIENVTSHMHDGCLHSHTSSFINELNIEIRLWKSIREEIEALKVEHAKHFKK